MRRSAPIKRLKPLHTSKHGLHAKRQRPRSIKPLRQEDPERLARVRKLPCLGCLKDKIVQDSPTEAHHIKRQADGQFYRGGQKAHDRETIPLCSGRHHWNGVHCQAKLSHREFERRYGDERELLAETDAMLAAGLDEDFSPQDGPGCYPESA
jgi:hypothetical protein